MTNELTAADKRKKLWYEVKDLLLGTAFPLILMLVLSSTIISFSSFTSEVPLQAVILAVGEVMLIGSYIIFGKQNGATAQKKSLQNSKKRDIGTDDLKAVFGTGEYAVYKGFLIGFLSCVPYIIFQIIGSAFPNKGCDFILQYAFGWAYYPFALAKISSWLNLLWVIPLTCVHAGAYVWGANKERTKQKLIEEAQAARDNKGKNKKK